MTPLARTLRVGVYEIECSSHLLDATMGDEVSKAT